MQGRDLVAGLGAAVGAPHDLEAERREALAQDERGLLVVVGDQQADRVVEHPWVRRWAVESARRQCYA